MPVITPTRVLTFLSYSVLLCIVVGAMAFHPSMSMGGEKPFDSTEQQQLLLKEAKKSIDSWHGDPAPLITAKAILDQLLEKDPKLVPAHLQMYRFYKKDGYISRKKYKPGSLESAERHLKLALRYDPGYADTYVFYADLYLLKNNAAAARQALEKAKTIGTQDPWFDLEWADLLRLEGKKEEAGAALNKLIAGGTTDKTVLAAAYDNLITYYMERKEFAEVKTLYEKMFELDPTNAWSRGNYADFLLYELGDVDGAIRYADIALRIMNYGMGRFTLASALYAKWAGLYMEKRQPEEAKKYFAAAQEVYPYMDSVMASSGRFEKPNPTAPALKAVGVSIDARDSEGFTALYKAAYWQRTETAKQLLDLGADPNLPCGCGWTPLLRATYDGNTDLVKLLLAHGADPTETVDNKDALAVAHERGHEDLVKLLERGMPPAPANGLVAWYRLDETNGPTVADASEQHNSATNIGATVVGGKHGNGLSFDGKSYVSATNSSSRLMLTHMTLMAWIKPTTSSTFRPILRKGANGALNYRIQLDPNNYLWFDFDSSGGFGSLRSTVPVPADGTTWTHVAATYDGTALVIYINGQERGRATLSGSPKTTSSQELYLGRDADQNQWYQGVLDEVKIYNTALGPREIQAEANASRVIGMTSKGSSPP